MTCHEQLRAALRERMGARDVDLRPVPRQAKFANDPRNDTGHWPRRYHELMEELREIEAGTLWLVAAGMVGKPYCEVIREAGGIAVDIGHAADVWVGMGTRQLRPGRGAGDLVDRLISAGRRTSRAGSAAAGPGFPERLDQLPHPMMGRPLRMAVARVVDDDQRAGLGPLRPSRDLVRTILLSGVGDEQVDGRELVVASASARRQASPSRRRRSRARRASCAIPGSLSKPLSVAPGASAAATRRVV